MEEREGESGRRQCGHGRPLFFSRLFLSGPVVVRPLFKLQARSMSSLGPGLFLSTTLTCALPVPGAGRTFAFSSSFSLSLPNFHHYHTSALPLVVLVQPYQPYSLPLFKYNYSLYSTAAATKSS